MKNVPKLFTVTIVLLTSIFTGCARLSDADETTRFRPETEYVLLIVIDMSGSFADKMTEDGAAHNFLMAVIQKFTRQLPGNEGQLIIAQVSGNDQELIWQGHPRELKRDFTPESFRKFLLQKSDPSQSRIYAGVASATRHLLNHKAVQQGAKPGLFVLSDFVDNTPDSDQQARAVRDLMNELGQRNGIVGFYYLDQRFLPAWQQALSQSEVRDFKVEGDFVSRPVLPDFF